MAREAIGFQPGDGGRGRRFRYWAAAASYPHSTNPSVTMTTRLAGKFA